MLIATFILSIVAGVGLGAGGVGGTIGIVKLVQHNIKKKKEAQNAAINNELDKIHEKEGESLDTLTETIENTEVELQESIIEACETIHEVSGKIADSVGTLQNSILEANDSVSLLKTVVESSDEKLKPILQNILSAFEDTQKINVQLIAINRDLNGEKEELHKEIDELKQMRVSLEKQISKNSEKIMSLLQIQQSTSSSNPDLTKTITELSNQLNILFRKNLALETENRRLSQVVASSSQNDNTPSDGEEEPSRTHRFGLFSHH